MPKIAELTRGRWVPVSGLPARGTACALGPDAPPMWSLSTPAAKSRRKREPLYDLVSPKQDHTSGSEGRCRRPADLGCECKLRFPWVRIPGCEPQALSLAAHLEKVVMEGRPREAAMKAAWESREGTGKCPPPRRTRCPCTRPHGDPSGRPAPGALGRCSECEILPSDAS